MNKQTATTVALLLVSAITGCASMPEVTAGYYLPRSRVDITVTQTATCLADVPIVANSALITPSYSRDPSKLYTVDMGSLGNAWSKTNAGFKYYDDGRLKSVNMQQTGQGGEALNALIKLATVFATPSYVANQVKDACASLRKIVGVDKALTIVHRGVANFEKDEKLALNRDILSDSEYAALQPIYGTPSVQYKIASAPAAPHVNSEKRGQKLELVEPAEATVTVTLDAGRREEFSGVAWVPQYGTHYYLPIQKAPLFGENEFELALNEAGKVTELRYAGSGDAAGAFGVLSGAVTAAQGETTSEEAARLQAEADLIHQQQRLVLCMANPTACPS